MNKKLRFNFKNDDSKIVLPSFFTALTNSNKHINYLETSLFLKTVISDVKSDFFNICLQNEKNIEINGDELTNMLTSSKNKCKFKSCGLISFILDMYVSNSNINNYYIPNEIYYNNVVNNILTKIFECKNCLFKSNNHKKIIEYFLVKNITKTYIFDLVNKLIHFCRIEFMIEFTKLLIEKKYETICQQSSDNLYSTKQIDMINKNFNNKYWFDNETERYNTIYLCIESIILKKSNVIKMIIKLFDYANNYSDIELTDILMKLIKLYDIHSKELPYYIIESIKTSGVYETIPQIYDYDMIDPSNLLELIIYKYNNNLFIDDDNHLKNYLKNVDKKNFIKYFNKFKHHVDKYLLNYLHKHLQIKLNY